MVKRINVLIYGDVTGVGFRAWTLRQAQDKQLTGWVRNADMDKVEAVFEGESEKVNEMIELCKKGPDVGWVEKVELKEEKVLGDKNFEIRF